MITLKQDPIFALCINGRELPGFRLISEWEGLKKLQRSDGCTIILAPSRTVGLWEQFANQALKGFSNADESKSAEEYFVVMASPDVATWIKQGSNSDANGCNGVAA